MFLFRDFPVLNVSREMLVFHGGNRRIIDEVSQRSFFKLSPP